jgi:hypothetical protein
MSRSAVAFLSLLACCPLPGLLTYCEGARAIHVDTEPRVACGSQVPFHWFSPATIFISFLSFYTFQYFGRLFFTFRRETDGPIVAILSLINIS